MLTRRQFVGPISAAALAVALPRSASAVQTAASGTTCRFRVDLNGTWLRYVNGEFFGHVQVPSSHPPLGQYELKRHFLLPQLENGQRAILHFEGTTYQARVLANGAELGALGPYMPYEFDATSHLRTGANEVSVAIRDLLPGPDGEGKDAIELGINPGWEGYGGIVRDTYVETRPAAYIENVRVAYKLAPSYDSVRGAVTAFVSSIRATAGKLRISLADGETEAFSSEQPVSLPGGSGEAEVSFEFKGVALWSPDRPNLYRLIVQLHCGSDTDEYACRIGFRHTDIRGSNFYLNGEKIKLHGLSWLGTWKDQGFTLTRKQMMLDMRGMKDMGCNFVRLHLFPQDRYMVELADELGMLICEEPGYWQVDFTKMRHSLIDLGLDIMARTIRRDWNSPSVFAWLLCNESELTTDYLKLGAELCRKLDPIRRFVSCANHHSGKKVKSNFDEAGLDFYSAHPYDLDPAAFDRACDSFGTAKPLVFDEWGGRAIGQSEIILQQQADRILELMEQDRLAGEMFFSWNDFLEFGRIDGEMVDGICESGIVSETREQRQQVFSQVSLLFQGRYQHADTKSLPLILEPLRRTPWSSAARFVSIDLQTIVDSAAAKQSWAALEKQVASRWETTWLTQGQWKRAGEKLEFWKDIPIEILGVPFVTPLVAGFARPLAVTAEVPEVEIPIRQRCSRLHILGQINLPSGFPLAGEVGRKAAEYIVKYPGGRTHHIPLRHGIEVCCGSLIHQASRIAPAATSSQHAITYIRNYSRERYQVLLFSVDVAGPPIESLTLSLEPQQPPLLLFALSLELPSSANAQ